MKKLKGFDGHATAMGNGSAENRGGDVNGSSKSGGDSVEGSSDAVMVIMQGGNKTQRKRSSEDIGAPGDGKVDAQANAAHGGETSASSKMSLGITVAPPNISGKPVGTGPSSSPTPGMEFRVATTGKVQTSGTTISPAAGAMMPGRNRGSSELWIQDERELKRERRKQSNRESARRSRLRKQVH
ncbi:common plant regulatory factor 1-like [Phoenix dactylifera]|uniref:Common plant regulatory factor 1-like n=1 Tax=Phoenix dactylifera TaxID=42345 RepID=A0A8B8ZLY3_PHODC|nr:common plant regulatory factor 1-like [Phoenix dactylifera]XP_038972633.1 common plant regulatory factor 1-like [Phoenix dactylifera]XP_038972634.1 common plant regulatory factor 1-like [Phoenix dactylifera]